MKNKKVVLGITGSIAAYKAIDLARSFVKLNCDVTSVMTKAATRFITPLTLESITGNKVTTDLFANKGFSHLNIASNAHLVVIAPATANFISKAAVGIADDALSTIFLAANCQKVVAPAMNYRMYQNKIIQKNILTLKKNGVVFIGPEKGKLACGEVGIGRLAKIQDIFKTCISEMPVNSSAIFEKPALDEQAKSNENKSFDLKGKNFLVTAGGTKEMIDAVRCISNLSSGKTGMAIVKELASRGANVTLLTSQPFFYSVENKKGKIKIVYFNDHYSLKKQMDMYLEKTDCLIMSAAVSDFKPVKYIKDKLKRNNSLSIQLKPTSDLLEEAAKIKDGKIIIGFAAETSNIEENAFKKLKKKNLDMIIANDVSKNDSGIGKDYCEFVVIYPSGRKIKLKKQLKTSAAVKIVDLVAELMEAVAG